MYYNEYLSEKITRTIPKNELFICLFSGGKDSMLALSLAMQTGICKTLLHCTDDSSNYSLNSFQELQVIKHIAKAIEVPIFLYKANWKNLIELLKNYKNQGVNYVVSGDVRSEGIAKTHIYFCKCAGMIPCMPLWMRPYDELFSEIENEGIKSIITAIRHPFKEKQCLGRIYDRNLYEHFKYLNIDCFGENGEFQSTTIHANCFKNPFNVRYSIDEICQTTSLKGDVAYLPINVLERVV